MQNQQQPQLDVKLNNTHPIENSNGNPLFHQGVILRRVSKFIAGGDNDALLPIPVFYCPESKKIVTDSVPTELREELKDYLM